MTIEAGEIAELEALMAGDPGEVDDDPSMADEAAAAAILRRLGEAQREAADVESLYEHFEQELQDKLAKLGERKAERMAPLRKKMADAERWLHGWHLAQVGEKNGKPTRLTIHLPTGTLKLGAKGADVDVAEPETFLAWAEEHAASLVVQLERPPQPPPRPDGRALRSYALEEIGLLPEEPEPGTTLEPVPGVRVTIKARKFTVTPDV